MIVAVSMMRDEADIAGQVVSHLYNEGVDLVIVADNLSTDGTGDLARDAGADVVEDPNPAYLQADKMTALAHMAIDAGAEWVLPFDADEVWYSPSRTIAHALADTAADVIVARGWDHIATLGDLPYANPFEAITHRRSIVQRLPKVAFRAHPSARLTQGNHDVTHPGPRTHSTLAYRHFQYRSVEQMIRKARQGTAAYQATNLPESEGAHWRQLAAMDDISIAGEWARLCQTPNLVFDPAPVR